MIGPAEVFVDTNVLIYARDLRERVKRDRARAWLAAMGERECMRLNLQVLNELTRWTLVNETSRSLADIREEIEVMQYWGDAGVRLDEIDAAWAIRAERGYQWFDCLLLAAANRLGCRYFLTEDMAAGERVGSATIVNPFQALPSDILSH